MGHGQLSSGVYLCQTAEHWAFVVTQCTEVQIQGVNQSLMSRTNIYFTSVIWKL